MTSLAATVHAYREIAKNGSLRRVLFAFLLFNAAEFAVWIAVLLYAYERGGTTTAGVVAIAQLLPAILVAPLGSVVGDRLRRDHALALGYAIQAGSNAAVALAMWFGPPSLVYAGAIVAASAVTLTRPVHNAILPDLAATPRQLTAANSASSTAEGLGVMLGPLLNAVLVVLQGPALVAAVFAVSIGVAALLTFRLSVSGSPAVSTSDDDDARGLVADALDGVRQLRTEPGALSLMVLGGAQYFVVGVLDVFWAAMALELLGLGPGGAGVLASVFGVGGLIGAGLTAVLVGRRRMMPPIEVSLVVVGAALAAIALATTVGVAFVLIAAAGAARMFFDVAARTLLQRTVKDEALARVFGLQEGLVMFSLMIGAAVAPVMAAVLGIRGAFVACGMLLPLAGLVSYATLRALDQRAVQPDPARLAIVGANPIFSGLPQHVLERLTWHLFPVTAAAGDVVIREGEAGDRFYLIREGEAVVESGGREVATVSAGGYVGEIALLRNVPRTATVRAVTDLDLLALERWEFLAAVTGSRPSSLTANVEIDRRLAELERSESPSQNRNNSG